MVSGWDTCGRVVTLVVTEVEPVCTVVSEVSLTPVVTVTAVSVIPGAVVVSDASLEVPVLPVTCFPGASVESPGLEFSGLLETVVEPKVVPVASLTSVVVTSVEVVARVLEPPGAMVVPAVIPVVTTLTSASVVLPCLKVVASVSELSDGTVVPETTPVVPVSLSEFGVSELSVVAPVLEFPGELLLPGTTPVVPVFFPLPVLLLTSEDVVTSVFELPGANEVPEVAHVGSETTVLPVPWLTVSVVASVFHPVEVVASVLELPGATVVLKATPVRPL